MLVDKPPWVVHDRACGQLYGVDVCVDGVRFATAGGDHKVKIWALPPVLHAAAEQDVSTPRLLATLAEHFGPVNTLRFSCSGRRLATGSDDKLVLVHELRAGAPKAVFGAAGPPAVENWQARRAAACVLATSRAANVVAHGPRARRWCCLCAGTQTTSWTSHGRPTTRCSPVPVWTTSSTSGTRRATRWLRCRVRAARATPAEGTLRACALTRFCRQPPLRAARPHQLCQRRRV